MSPSLSQHRMIQINHRSIPQNTNTVAGIVGIGNIIIASLCHWHEIFEHQKYYSRSIVPPGPNIKFLNNKLGSQSICTTMISPTTWEPEVKRVYQQIHGNMYNKKAGNRGYQGATYAASKQLDTTCVINYIKTTSMWSTQVNSHTDIA
jgi:hypothetical protein